MNRLREFYFILYYIDYSWQSVITHNAVANCSSSSVSTLMNSQWTIQAKLVGFFFYDVIQVHFFRCLALGDHLIEETIVRDSDDVARLSELGIKTWLQCW